ncbi:MULTISPECIES: MFS transporter [Rhizobium/Agrobacterium group]|uniref:MFS transporter n=1 Tax=Agrobacterium vitis TaxID=373 RepID=A0ABD6H6C2_AGRVI|nr:MULTISPECIES: MFS transporter [Rhizobium/Agrobacterium group]MCF1446799.1 MFS transporter [Allorhizobium ampelinum]MCF1491686.1 MFS transporter [Allorhizobium ampelinum]MUO28930.1 MFS transporter [Agrobacterium vitis]MUO43296.1 MFS transporter [Agrobacterium vitis]MUP09900.1 MFS transporter [Agrobacterium vitis]
MSISQSEDRFAAFRHSAYTKFFFARFLAAFAMQIVSVAVGWQMYEVTGNALYLGLIGLVQFLPALLLVLVTGTVADHFNRRMIVAICLGVSAACVALLLVMTINSAFAPLPVLIIMTIFGIERAFMGPAVQSLAANMVPEKDLANSFAWNASSWQIASILGPVAGGLLYGFGANVAYGVSLAFMAAGLVFIILVPKSAKKTSNEPKTLTYLLAGFKFIRHEKVVLGAISLDLFAVLLGGALALMPIYASDILTMGPLGLGILRSAPGIGGILMATFLATFPIRHKAGLLMFVGVAIFGIATIVFGVSKVWWISAIALAVLGAGDMISVYVRETLLALWTPDQVRGRVNAVNSVFIGASNELGEFRAGTMAHLIGPVGAVVIGGVGTLAVSIIWALTFPKLRTIDTLEAPDKT